MTENISIKSQVDSALLYKVEQECFQILYQQRLLYNERWYSSDFLNKTRSIARLVGMSASIFGVIFSVFYLVYPSSCPKWFFAELALLFFIGTTLLFYYLPRLEARIISRMKKAGSNSCKRMARRFMSKARKSVSYVAEYNIKGDFITFIRGKENGNSQQVWSKRIKGYAILGENVTLSFRKPTSLVPTMLILYENNEVMESVLKDTEIPYTRIATV